VLSVSSAPIRRDRWEVIAAYALVAAANQMLWVTFTPITTPAAHHYGVSTSDIGWLSEIFPLLYVILAVPCATLLDRWFRPSLVLGATLTAIGGAVRIADPSFAGALIGQVLVAVGQPLVLNAITGLASAYLKPQSRPIGIALGSAGIFLGMLVALTLGSALGGARIHALLVLGAVLSVLPALFMLGVLGAGEHPPIVGDVTGRDGMRAVWNDPIIRRLALISFVGFGLFVALTTWLQALLKPAGIHASTAGWLLVASVCTGVIASAFLPPMIARARAEAAMFRTAAAGAGAACVLLALWRDVAPVAVGCCVIGFLLLSCLPVLLEVAEHRAGRAGTSATALIWLAGNAGGIVIAILVQIVEGHPTVAFLLMAVIAAIGAALAPRGMLRRNETEPPVPVAG
jgi:predicted MFS family arabinose efflux permease